MHSPLMALDFDGVICDSQLECMMSSYYAWHIFKKHKIKISYDINDIPLLLRKLFLRYRYLVRVGKEYLLLWSLLIEGWPIDENLSLNKQITFSASESIAMEICFYEQRKQWIKKDIKSFFFYNKFYSDLFSSLRKWTTEGRLYIVSSKDRNSISLLLQYNKIYLNPKYIYSREKGDKEIILQSLVSQYPAKKIIFVDDLLSNLERIAHLPVQCIGAAWGYEKIDTIKQSSLEFLSLEAFCQRFGVLA